MSEAVVLSTMIEGLPPPRRGDVSQFETIASLIGPMLLDSLVTTAKSTASGNRSQEAPAAPHRPLFSGLS